MNLRKIAWAAVIALVLFVVSIVLEAEDSHTAAQTVALVGIGVAILALRDR